MTMTDPTPASLRDAMACTLYEHDSAEIAGAPPWIGDRLDREHPGLRARYLGRADALLGGPIAGLLALLARQGEERRMVEEEVNVLRRQRMGPERERELLEANNRMLERAQASAAAQAAAEAALPLMQRERDVAREAETFWQQFAFDADDLATQRLVKLTAERNAAERMAILERAQRERVETALRLFADRADTMPKEGWVSDLAGMNRDMPLWWFHAARVALERAEPKAADDHPR